MATLRFCHQSVLKLQLGQMVIDSLRFDVHKFRKRVVPEESMRSIRLEVGDIQCLLIDAYW